MSFLRLLTPTNLLQEKEKFFADFSYNPQFTYSEPIEQEKFAHYGVPEPQYQELAQEILDRTFAQFSEKDIEHSEGKKLSQALVEEKILTFLKMHGLEDRYSLIWSSSFISRTSINSEKIKLRLPTEFREESLLGMIYHEIGTHALRRVNYEQQPWYKKKKKFGFSEYLFTEEGLAGLHGLLPHSIKLAYKQARLYLGVAFAQKHSFVETWNYLNTYIDNPEKRWTLTMRLKRGVTDTNQPGGYTKDLVYFKGLVETWEWLKNNSWDCTSLYLGKLAVNDAEKAQQLNPEYKPKTPTFFCLKREEYSEKMLEIGKQNYLF